MVNAALTPSGQDRQNGANVGARSGPRAAPGVLEPAIGAFHPYNVRRSDRRSEIGSDETTFSLIGRNCWTVRLVRRTDRGTARHRRAPSRSGPGRTATCRQRECRVRFGDASDSPTKQFAPLSTQSQRVGRSGIVVDMAVKIQELLKQLSADGWVQVRQKGSHRQFHHPTKPGTVTVAGKASLDIPPGTLNNISKQAGLKK